MGSNIKIDVRKERLQNKNSEDEFRDSIATVDEKGKRLWIYPKKPSGKFHGWRIVVTIILLSLLFGGPFIKINGQPLLLLNVLERKFIIFGQAFWPQDFVLLAVTLIAFFVFVILFTVVFGRVWCGWLCPQTLFMEMVFRKIEYWIEGDAAAQRRLSKEKWNAEKIFKKTSKQTIFILISILDSTYGVGLFDWRGTHLRDRPSTTFRKHSRFHWPRFIHCNILWTLCKVS